MFLCLPSKRRHRNNNVLRFLLKETNDELLRVSRGSLLHIEGAAKVKPRLPMTVETAWRHCVRQSVSRSRLTNRSAIDKIASDKTNFSSHIAMAPSAICFRFSSFSPRHAPSASVTPHLYHAYHHVSANGQLNYQLLSSSLQCFDNGGWASGRAPSLMMCWCGYLSGVRCRLLA